MITSLFSHMIFQADRAIDICRKLEQLRQEQEPPNVLLPDTEVTLKLPALLLWTICDIVRDINKIGMEEKP